MKILSFVFVFLLSVTNCQKIGEPCTDKKGSPGICRKISDCSSVVISPKIRTFPKLCGIEENSRIICCKKLDLSLPPINKSFRKPGEISQQKCREYAEYVFETENSVILLPGAKARKVYKCNINVKKLIVGGTKAEYKEFPHMARIGYKNGDEIEYHCGGSIISKNFILTTAHCIEHKEFGEATVAAIGMSNLRDRSTQVVKIVERFYHPAHRINSHYHDIGLLRFEGAKINSGARPACLHTSRTIENDRALATGWGSVRYMEPESEDLMKVTLDLVNTSECQNKFTRNYGSRKLKFGILDELQICAGSRKKEDTCQGDSGGPLQVYHDKSDAKCMYELIGVTSFGIYCGLANSPAVYTRISNYTKWIEDIVWPV